MRRSGNVCDTLVYLLVAALLPAWLLGHLFLTFFPASGSPMGSHTGADPTDAVAALDDAGSSVAPAGGMTKLHNKEPDSAASSANAQHGKVQWQQEITSFKTKISGLNTENQNLAFKATELEELKSKQDKEIAELKNRLEQISNESGREKVASMSTELQNIQNEYAQLDQKFTSIQREKSQLASQLTDLELKNQQLAMSTGASDGNEDVEQLETEVQKLAIQLRESKNDLAEQKRIAAQMQDERPSDSETTEALVAASEKLLGQANAEKSRLQGRVNELITDLNVAKSNLADQKNELTETNNQLQQLNAKYALTLKRLAAGTPTRSRQPSNTPNAEPSNQINTPQPTQPRNTAQPANEEYREYVSSLGNRSRLAFIQWIGDDQVVVRSFANKQLYQVPIERFSAPDRQYLRSIKQTNGQ